MKTTIPFKFLAFGIFMLIWVSAVTAIAATNTVPSTRADEASAGIGTNTIKPYACSGLYLAGTISGSGTITGTAGNDLILGTSGADTIDGLGGNDCIVGGGGDDVITGGDGNDICLGGGGSNTVVDCEN